MNVICDTFGRGKVGLYSISGNGLDQGISTFSKWYAKICRGYVTGHPSIISKHFYYQRCLTGGTNIFIFLNGVQCLKNVENSWSRALELSSKTGKHFLYALTF